MNKNADHGLSDVLRQMASGEQVEQPTSNDPIPEVQPAQFTQPASPQPRHSPSRPVARPSPTPNPAAATGPKPMPTSRPRVSAPMPDPTGTGRINTSQPQQANTTAKAAATARPRSGVQPATRRINTTRTTNRTTKNRKKTTRPRSSKANQGLKATAAPLLGTVGVLLLIPGVWAVLTLSGMNVAGSAREDAQAMAWAMLVCWPIAICLLVTAIIFFVQMLRDKKAR